METVAIAAEPPPELFPWLKTLPLAPEYHPTLAEFQDPISYILKIEKEVSKYGICKIVPPLPPLPKKTVITNLNRSLAVRNPNSSCKSPPKFTTRQQRIGFCPRKPRPVQKPVWHSGETYTLQQFEAKAKQFEKSYLRRIGKKGLSELEIETLFWKAFADKPFTVEYANDMPGSAFAQLNEKKWRKAGEATTVGETGWNMRGVSRAKGSLLRFMKEEIPGVTSPMMYIAMMFSWFAWHVEDHDLHSLNYLHMGAGKTWYGVPREAAVAFEEVIRVHGYGGEVNPLVTFSILGEKTTVMSPEVLISARIPCCRLVQNAGEFVVTFPRAYHCGFSHGFNCGEAANIATPEWLRVAKEAAIRRASINYPPMVSHFQLLYALALTLCSRLPASMDMEPRSSRLKDKKRGEAETMVKELFVQNVIQNNDLLHVLGRGSSCILLPQKSSGISVRSKLHVRSQFNARHGFSLGLCSSEKAIESSRGFLSNDTRQDQDPKHLSSFSSVKETSAVYERNMLLFGNANLCSSTTEIHGTRTESESNSHCDELLDQGLFSCVTCGILGFGCVAVIQPKAAASHYLMSADCSFFNDSIVGSGVNSDRHNAASGNMNIVDWNSCSDSDCEPACPSNGRMTKSIEDGLYDVPVQSDDYQVQVADRSIKIPSDTEAQKHISSLHLLAFAYGDPSDSEEDGTHHSDAERERIDCGHADYSIPSNSSSAVSNCSSVASFSETTKFGNAEVSVDNTNISVMQRSVENSCRMHIFCLEHAVEVEKQLRPIGGVNMLLLCHPDYPKVETEAKSLAEDLGIDYIWNDSPFREATKEDLDRIQSVMDNEEAIDGSGDWTVKLGINLYYSANLSHSPLYSKQMPYNSVIYNAFGRSSPTNSPTKPKVSRRRHGKKKKIAVAGKWCGKVWMANQIHPYMAQKSNQEHEHARSFHARTTPDEKLDRKPDSTLQAEQKRKKILVKGSRKKMKSSQTEEPSETSRDSPENSSTLQCARFLRSGKLKQDNHNKKGGFHDLYTNDEIKGGPSTRLRRRSSKPTEDVKVKLLVEKQTKKRKLKKASTKKDTSIKEEAEYQCDIDGCSMSFGSKQELALHKSNICSVKGCGKKFFSHKYLVQHKKVHIDDRPLKCPWKGCKMTFKWAWARTEHIRVHTGARPYVCHEAGCGQTFRFVSDFSRHKRRTGHSVKKAR